MTVGFCTVLSTVMVTIFKNISTVNTGFLREIDEIFDRIRSGTSKELILKIRAENDKEKRDKLKQELPSICFSGEFSERRISCLIKHSGFICLDFDKVDDLEVLRETIQSDPYTYACFVSPSGNGLKVIVRIPAKREDHLMYFRGLQDYYNCEEFDKSTNDVSRVCYESYDPEIFINKESKVFETKPEVELHELGVINNPLPITENYTIIQHLRKWWDAKYGFVPGQRNENLIKLGYAFNDFGIHKDEARAVFSDYETSNFTSKELDTIINSAYKKTEKFGTKQFEDYGTKSQIKNEIIKGKPVADIKAKFSKVANIAEVIDNIKEETNILEFWDISKQGKYSVVHNRFKEYLQTNKIYKYYTGGGSFVFVKINENRVTIPTVDKIKDFVLKDLYTREGLSPAPYNMMAGTPKYFKQEYLNMLDTIEIQINKDTKDKCYLYYTNTVLEITKDNVREISYLDLNGYVWEEQIIPRVYLPTDGKKGQYREFLWLISGKKDERYNSFRSAIGYLVHSYKTSANNRAIILNDEVISEHPNGGSGKGIFSNAIGYLKKSVKLNGKQFNFDKSFVYQRVNPDTQLLIFDDVKKNFDFERLFSLITEGIDIEKKNKDEIYISVEDSPKVLINTNYTIGGIGGSFVRRKYELELSSFFNDQNTPQDHFKGMLFGDWDKYEWSKFDNFMIRCTQYFLEHGLVEVVHTNLKTRKFIQATCHEFYEWVKESVINRPGKHYNKDLVDDFTQEYSDMLKNKWFNNRKFSSWVDAYIKYSDRDSDRRKDSGGRYIFIYEDKVPF